MFYMATEVQLSTITSSREAPSFPIIQISHVKPQYPMNLVHLNPIWHNLDICVTHDCTKSMIAHEQKKLEKDDFA